MSDAPTTTPAVPATKPAPGEPLRPGLNPALNDGLPWDELAAQYNFRHPTGRGEIFARLLREHLAGLSRPTRVLDIGCGKGIELDVGLTRSIRPLAGEFWGIEPDSGIAAEPGLFEQYQHALMETAKLPENYFDVAYSFMVMEHVKEPRPFMEAVARCLKPGGSYVFGTINGSHYFARIAATLRVLKLDELILRVVRGKSTVEEYHYPVFYRVNTARVIARLAEELGFEEPEFLYLEQSGPDDYLRGPLRPILRLMQWKRDVIHNPRALLVLVCRLTKKGGAGEGR
jgi:SAM-dependent methyltransferase